MVGALKEARAMEAMVVMVVVRFEWMMQMLHSRRASGTEGRFRGRRFGAEWKAVMVWLVGR